MKKILLPLAVAFSLAACKKEATTTDDKLEILIKNKDIKGLQAYKERQRYKLDSMSAVIADIDKNLTALGASTAVSGKVLTMPLALSNFVHYIEIQGNVTTDQDVTVQPQFAGTLSLYVRQGQAVRRGQVIGRVADGGLADQVKQAQIQVSAVQAQLAQAKASTDLARITFQKQASLWNQKIGSELQYLQAKTNYEASQRQVAAVQSQVAATQKAADAVRANLAKTAIVAPFSGVVDDVLTQNGQIVAPGTPIVKLISLGTMRVEANVPESYLANVRPGSRVEVFLPNLNKRISSSIRLIGNYINPTNRTFTIQVPIQNEGGIIKPNLLAQLKIQDYVNPSAIQVPSQYIYEDAAKRQYVFTAVNAKSGSATARKVLVETGERSENSVEIVKGLKAGDVLITDGSKNLVDGQKVKI